MPNLSLDRLKRAYRTHLRGLAPDTRLDCPPPAELMRFFSDDASRGLKTRILDHVAGCGPCADEFEILMEIDRAARALGESTAKLAGSRSGTPFRKRETRGFWSLGRLAATGAGLAAAAAWIFILGDRTMNPRPDEPDVLRVVKAPAGIRLDGPAGPVDAGTAVAFRWSLGGDPAGAEILVCLYDESLACLWESQTDDAGVFFLPQDIQVTLIPGRRYYWGVTLLSVGDGADSDLNEFWLVSRRREANNSASPVRK